MLDTLQTGRTHDNVPAYLQQAPPPALARLYAEAGAAALSLVTDAERFGWSFVFHLFLPDDFPDTRGVASAPWWRQVYGADWAHPAGPQSDLDGVDDETPEDETERKRWLRDWYADLVEKRAAFFRAQAQR